MTVNIVSHEKSIQCVICKRPAKNSSLCDLHYLAKEKINQNYNVWNAAYSGLIYSDYLKSLMVLPESGKSVVEVATLLLRDKGEATGKDINNLRET